MCLTGSLNWRWSTVSCGYLSWWYWVGQWEGGRVTGPRRHRLALPHSNRWDYARCLSLIDGLVVWWYWLVGRSTGPTHDSSSIVVSGWWRWPDGVSTERTEHFDRPYGHVRGLAGRCRPENGDQEISTKRDKLHRTHWRFWRWQNMVGVRLDWQKTRDILLYRR